MQVDTTKKGSLLTCKQIPEVLREDFGHLLCSQRRRLREHPSCTCIYKSYLELKCTSTRAAISLATSCAFESAHQNRVVDIFNVSLNKTVHDTSLPPNDSIRDLLLFKLISIAMATRSVTCSAPVNIAVIKYCNVYILHVCAC